MLHYSCIKERKKNPILIGRQSYAAQGFLIKCPNGSFARGTRLLCGSEPAMTKKGHPSLQGLFLNASSYWRQLFSGKHADTF